MIRLSLQPSPASEMPALNRMRAFRSRAAELLPLRITASSLPRSSALSRTTYRFTTGARAAIISSIAPIAMAKELLNPCEIVEAGGSLGSGLEGLNLRAGLYPVTAARQVAGGEGTLSRSFFPKFAEEIFGAEFF